MDAPAFGVKRNQGRVLGGQGVYIRTQGLERVRVRIIPLKEDDAPGLQVSKYPARLSIKGWMGNTNHQALTNGVLRETVIHNHTLTRRLIREKKIPQYLDNPQTNMLSARPCYRFAPDGRLGKEPPGDKPVDPNRLWRGKKIVVVDRLDPIVVRTETDGRKAIRQGRVTACGSGSSPHDP